MRILISVLALTLILTPAVYAEDEMPFELWSVLSRGYLSPGNGMVSFSAYTSAPATGSVSLQDAQGSEIKSVSFDSIDSVDMQWDGLNVPDGVYAFVAQANGLETRKEVTVDATPPLITLNGDQTIHHLFETPWSDPGVSLNEGTLLTQSNVSVSRLGTSTITYTATDQAGNKSQVVRTLLVEPKPVEIVLSNLTHAYDGSPKSAAVQKDPKLAVSVTYNGSEELPIAVGSYAVHAEAATYGYVGRADATITIAEKDSATVIVNTEVEKVVERVVEQRPAELEEVYKMVADVTSFTLDIEELQRALIRTGHLAIPAPTGIFGPLTQTAVRFYQLAHQLPATGYVYPAMLTLLEQEQNINEQEVLESLLTILQKVEELAASL